MSRCPTSCLSKNILYTCLNEHTSRHLGAVLRFFGRRIFGYDSHPKTWGKSWPSAMHCQPSTSGACSNRRMCHQQAFAGPQHLVGWCLFDVCDVISSRPTWCVSVDTWGHPQREQKITRSPLNGARAPPPGGRPPAPWKPVSLTLDLSSCPCT